jgi:hypothetical protein
MPLYVMSPVVIVASIIILSKVVISKVIVSIVVVSLALRVRFVIKRVEHLTVHPNIS